MKQIHSNQKNAGKPITARNGIASGHDTEVPDYCRTTASYPALEEF